MDINNHTKCISNTAWCIGPQLDTTEYIHSLYHPRCPWCRVSMLMNHIQALEAELKRFKSKLRTIKAVVDDE